MYLETKEFQHQYFYGDFDRWVVTVNCVGVMGAGLALAFRQKFPSLASRFNELKIVPGSITEIDKFLFVATKNHWRNPSKLEWVENIIISMSELKGRTKLVDIGCQNGGLNRNDVRDLYKKYLSEGEGVFVNVS